MEAVLIIDNFNQKDKDQAELLGKEYEPVFEKCDFVFRLTEVDSAYNKSDKYIVFTIGLVEYVVEFNKRLWYEISNYLKPL